MNLKIDIKICDGMLMSMMTIMMTKMMTMLMVTMKMKPVIGMMIALSKYEYGDDDDNDDEDDGEDDHLVSRTLSCSAFANQNWLFVSRAS